MPTERLTVKDLLITFCECYEESDFSDCTAEELEIYENLGWIVEGNVTPIGDQIYKHWGMECPT